MYKLSSGEQSNHSLVRNDERIKGSIASSAAILSQLHDLATCIVRNAADAEELVQEALRRACRIFLGEPWPPELPERWRTWLSVVVRRLAIDRVRRRKRHPEQSLSALREEPMHRPGEEAANARREEECARLRVLMEELREKEPDSYRLLNGHYFEGGRVRELAQEMGLTPKAASHRLARLRERLRTRLLSLRDDNEAL